MCTIATFYSRIMHPKNLFFLILWLLPYLLLAQTKDELLKKGIDLVSKGKLEEAISYFDQILESDNKYSLAYCNRGEAHLKNRQYENALKDFSWVINFSNDKALEMGAAIHTAYIYRKKLVNLEKALKYSSLALSIDSLAEATLYSHALTLHSNRNFELAVVYYDKLIDIESSDPDYYYDRGIAKNALLKHDEAIADYDYALQLDSTYEAAYNNRGYVNLILENYDEAIEDFNRALKLEVYSLPYNNRGFAKLKLGDLKGAKLDCELAIKLDDANSWAYHYLGLVYYEMGDKVKACELFHKAVELGKEEVSDEIDEKC